MNGIPSRKTDASPANCRSTNGPIPFARLCRRLRNSEPRLGGRDIGIASTTNHLNVGDASVPSATGRFGSHVPAAGAIGGVGGDHRLGRLDNGPDNTNRHRSSPRRPVGRLRCLAGVVFCNCRGRLYRTGPLYLADPQQGQLTPLYQRLRTAICQATARRAHRCRR